jgi:uncharacterized protein YcnI
MSFTMPEFGPQPRSARRRGTGSRCTAGGVLALALIIGPAVAAQAHVHVDPDSTVAGTDTELAFRVPNESPSAGTTALTITLPQDRPFAEVSARVTPGWTVKVVTDPLPKPAVVGEATLTKAAHTVTWTATPGNAVPPEQYQEFYLSVGPLPASGEVMFTAKQTYSDGSVVSWDQPAVAGAAEPEHPAPSFTVTPAPAEAGAVEAEPAEEGSTSSTDTFGRLLAGAGLLAGLGAIGLMVARRSPRQALARPAAPVSKQPSALGSLEGSTSKQPGSLDQSAVGAGRPSV